MPAKKQATKALIRNLPPEWTEFRKLCMDEGVSANEKLRQMIIETVKENNESKSIQKTK